jgi:hypothetical protein
MSEQRMRAGGWLVTQRVRWIPTLAAAGLFAIAWGAGACEGAESGSGEDPTDTATQTTGGSGGSSSSSGVGGDPFDPEADACKEHPSEQICDHNAVLTCDPYGEIDTEQDCGDGVCVDGSCVLCIEGQYSCYGNEVRVCNTGVNPIQWDTIAHCDALSSQGCNPVTGACEPLAPIGNGPANPTGFYYQYGKFVKGGVFLGGCDVDSFGNYIYVNRGVWYADGEWLDVYSVEVVDSDGDGEVEPNQHPDNPDATGPIEERVLTYVGNYHVPNLGMVHHSEIYALYDRIYLLDAPANPGHIYEFVFATAVTTPAVAAPGIEFAQLGFDETSDTWYASHEYARQVWSFHQPTGEWVAEFAFPDLAGDHMDGLEVVTDPNTGSAYVYVSDMTSDYLGQYRRNRKGTWEQTNLFQYAGTGDYVEGMGFGAYNHFWITSGDALYEVGGGELQKFTEPEPPPT